MLVAGFPCQSFSNAGRKLAFDDDRGQLFYELVRLATACRFRALLLENVRGLLEPEVMAAVQRALGAAGYAVSTREFDAAALLPQRRRRVFLACFRDTAAAQALYRARVFRVRVNPNPSSLAFATRPRRRS